MTLLQSIFDPRRLAMMREQGYVREQSHPEFPHLKIVNYTDKAVYDNVWNDVTRQCRGLIYNSESMEILARPFPKFWSADQLEGRSDLGEIPWQEPYRVFEKVDGSLGILFQRPDGKWAIATRGSFDSEQARHATEIWNQRYHHTSPVVPDVTHLFEIIYPFNRIVVDNGSMDDLVYLGSVIIETGRTFHSSHPARAWRSVEEHPWRTPPDELLSQSSKNREGFVLWWPAQDFRLKIKFEEYQAAHRVIFGTNTKTIWRAMKDGIDLGLYVNSIPEEYQDAINDYAANLQASFHEYKKMIARAHEIIRGLNRKDQALWLQGHIPNKTIIAGVFAKLDNKPIGPIIWRGLEPERAQPLWDLTDDSSSGIMEES